MKEIISNTGAFRHVEAYKRYKLATLHGLPSDHHLIKPSEPRYLPHVNKAIVALGECISAEVSSSAQAKAKAMAAQAPVKFSKALRGGNTGGTSTDYSTDYSTDFASIDSQISKYHRTGVVHVDWLGLSFPACNEEQQQSKLLGDIQDILAAEDVSITPLGKGRHGYQECFLLVRLGDRAGHDVNVGMLYRSVRECGGQGVLLELSGAGCEILREFMPDIYALAVRLGGRISRLDLALDLPNDYCLEHGVTVPVLARAASRGEFRSRFTPAHVQQSMSQQGDWAELVFKGVSVDDYDPCKHGRGGLTQYVGAVTSGNQLCIYEKGKQLLGRVPDDKVEEFERLMGSNRTVQQQARLAKLIQDHGYDAAYEGARAWVRVERRVRRAGNKRDVPLEMMLDPTSAFCDGFDKLEELVQSVNVWLHAVGWSVAGFMRGVLRDMKNVLLTRKCYWGRLQVGRLVRTLQDEDKTAAEIVDILSWSEGEGLKEYIFDLLAPGGYVSNLPD